MRMKIVHVPGCYSLVVAENFGTHRKDHVVQSAFYMPGDAAEKALKEELLRSFANGVTQGYNMARHALEPPYISWPIEEIELEKTK